jgi:hypothetical protein
VKFGCAVLLDRVWDVEKLVNCSKTLRSVLSRLKTDNSDADIMNGRSRLLQTYNSNQFCLKAVVRCMGDDSIIAHLDNFLESYPSK